MSRVTMEWNGDAIVERVRTAAREAVDATVDEARDDARMTHTWKNTPTRWSKTGGQLESALVSEHADPGDPNPTGSFGFTRRRGFVGLFHEEATVHEHMYPALRPAGDRWFPTLAAKIRERLG